MSSRDHSKDEAFQNTIAGIQKSFGKSSIMKLNEKTSLNVEGFHSGSLALDIALGGKGIPRGRLIELFGGESSGKCLPADTYLFTENGIETISDVFDRNGLDAVCVSRNTPKKCRLVNRHGQLESTKTFTHNGRRRVCRITTQSGSEISSTINHPHLVMSERGNLVWRKTGDLILGDYLVSRRGCPFGANSLPFETAYALGALVADGRFEGSRIQFTNDDKDVIGICVPEVNRALAKDANKYPNNDAGSINFHWPCKDSVQAFYDDHGLSVGNAKDKYVPTAVLTGDRRCAQSFLQGYFDCECHVNVPRGTITVTSASKRLLKEVRLMLLQFGIVSILRKKTVSKYPDNDYWTIEIGGCEALRYRDLIGTQSSCRDSALQQLSESSGSTNFDSIPHMGLVLQDLYDAMETYQSEHTLFKDVIGDNPKAKLTYDRLGKILSLKGLPNNHLTRHLESLEHENFFFDRIEDIGDGGEVPTFDFEMSATHSFIANGFVTHNTTLCLHMIAGVQNLGGNVAFVDAEHALDPEWAQKLGVNLDELYLSQPTYGEEGLQIVDQLVAGGGTDLIVVDSVAALTPKAELHGEIGDSHVGLQARMMGQAMRKLAGAVSNTKATVVFINQIREKVGVMFGSPNTTPGGRALKFFSSCRVELAKISTLKDGDEAAGIRVRAKVVKNKIAPPFRRAEFDLIPEGGINPLNEMIDIAVDKKILKRSGAWYSFEGVNIGQGKPKTRETIENDNDLRTEIQSRVLKACNISYAKNHDEDVE